MVGGGILRVVRVADFRGAWGLGGFRRLGGLVGLVGRSRRGRRARRRRVGGDHASRREREGGGHGQGDELLVPVQFVFTSLAMDYRLSPATYKPRPAS